MVLHPFPIELSGPIVRLSLGRVDAVAANCARLLKIAGATRRAFHRTRAAPPLDALVQTGSGDLDGLVQTTSSKNRFARVHRTGREARASRRRTRKSALLVALRPLIVPLKAIALDREDECEYAVGGAAGEGRAAAVEKYRFSPKRSLCPA
jgi:hypothetical protein